MTEDSGPSSQCCNKKIPSDSDNPEEWFNQGLAYTEKADYYAAEECFRRVLKLVPSSPETMLNLGYVLDLQGRSEEARSLYESVLKISPENAKARYNRASHLLRRGDLGAGFADYEARFSAIKSADSRIYRQPRWDGSDLNGRSILVYCEQGLGDAIQFGRYIHLLAKLGGRVVLEVQESLISLMKSLEGVDQIVPKSSTPPLTDVHIPLLSLPHIFQTTVDTIPASVPYLAVPETLVSTWKARIGNDSGEVRIGLSWVGKEKPYPNRSCPPEFLLPLLSIPGVRFYSLQIGEHERFPLPSEFSAKVADITREIMNFSDTAALVANLDLVITIDTAVAHLAGALGKTVWVMLPYDSDWRWMVDCDDSPWYPTMRLFRQSRPGDWAGVVVELGQVLQAMLSQKAKPDDSAVAMLEARLQIALTLLENNAAEAAIAELRSLLLLLPDDPVVWFNLGRAYEEAGQFKEAVHCYRLANLHCPHSSGILLRLGEILLKSENFAEAELFLQQAYELTPDAFEILLDLGVALVNQGKNAEAYECCRKVLAIRPESPTARINMAYLQLNSGEYLDGFANFETRLEIKRYDIDTRYYPQPRWDGSPLNGKSILLFGEQGMGDVIQFARYIPMVVERGGKVIFEVDPPLVPLFDRFPGVTEVVAKSETPPLTDVYAYTLSLPHIFGTTLETVPSRMPYIVPDQAKVAEWEKLLSGESVCRIGLVWRGNPNNPTDHDRSCPLATFLPLANISGVRFFSLQVGAGTDEIISLKADMELLDYSGRLKDFSDTAALIANLDLVIGVDTAVIHLSGAMGKPVWVMLPHIYDWRWLVGRNDTPWYPTARVFWQEGPGDWNGIMARVKDALKQQLNFTDIDRAPLDIESCYNLGAQLKEDGDLAGAERCFRKIVEHSPDLPDPQHSLAVVLHLQGRFDEAIRHYRNAVALDPGFVQAHYNLANALLQLGLYQDAIQSVRLAIQNDPNHADSHWLLGMLLLQQGDFLNGWDEYEWRWKAKEFKTRFPDLGCPQWDGSGLTDKTVLIHMEQGRGDMIQFVRYAPLAVSRGAKVVVCAAVELVSLLATAEGVSQVVDRNGPLPEFDLHIPALSLPSVFGTTTGNIPNTIPYLYPDAGKVAAWRDVLPADGLFRIGIAWQGSSEHRDDHNRSSALAEFKLLADLSGVSLYSLQVGSGSEQIHELSGDMTVVDLTARIHDFADTAALMQNLDLVISVDTAVAHLVGALGKPVWLMLPYVAEWRWMLDRDDTPWYPTMTLFRQSSPGNWHQVMVEITQKLSRLLNKAGFHHQHGIDLLKSGHAVEAEHVFSLALRLDSGNAETHCNLGVALDAQGRYEEAIDCYREALFHNPDHMQALFNMGNAFMALGKSVEGSACYTRAVELKPDFVPAHLCLGEIAKKRREFDKARNIYLNVLAIEPGSVDALQGIAEICQAMEEFEQAVTAYKQVLVLEPQRGGSWNLLGTVYHAMERLEAAESCYRQALQLQPDRVVVLNNLAVVLSARGMLDEAVSVYRHLLEVDDTYAEGHWNLATALLARGEYLEGWREYEWRFKKNSPVIARAFLQPRWDGSSLEGKTILLHAEQGFGDTIQFVRYVPLLAERGGRVIVECQVSALKRLLLSLDGVSSVVVAGDPLPPFDCHLPLLSLPLLFGTTQDTIPVRIPYLAAEPADIELWRRRLGSANVFRVGLVWFGRQGMLLNRKRSCLLANFVPLAEIPNVEFHSLQIGEGVEQLRECQPGFVVSDFTADIKDFADTAAYMANLDLVITIDTAVAHLAGALGVRTWVLLPFGADWRWPDNREETPWYPAMQLFRQPAVGDWPAVMASVAEKLHECVSGNVHEEANKPVISTCYEQRPIQRADELQSTTGMRVGLAWSCRQDNPITLNRVCPLSALAPLFDLPGVTFFSLQLGARPEEIGKYPLIDLTSQIADFEDTAALMAHLDLVISIDTSVLHLAATGCPTWVILPHVADWRWLQHRNDTPWYPGMRLFRQPDFGDWDSVAQEVASELSRLSAKKTGREAINEPGRVISKMSEERIRLERDLDRHRMALYQKPYAPASYLDLGASLALLGKFEEAASCFRKAIDLDQDNITGHMNLAYSLLALGEYAEGFLHHEWRLRKILSGQLPPWPLLRREEFGTHAVGTSILVHCEQGFGDTILFCRYLPLLADAGYRVFLSCQPPLASLLTSLRDVSQVVPHGEPLPVCDLQVLLLTLPGLFSATPDNIPAVIPYLIPREQRVIAWKSRVDAEWGKAQDFF